MSTDYHCPQKCGAKPPFTAVKHTPNLFELGEETGATHPLSPLEEGIQKLTRGVADESENCPPGFSNHHQKNGKNYWTMRVGDVPITVKQEIPKPKEKPQAQSFQGPMAPPAAQSEKPPQKYQDESVRKAPDGNIEKAEPPVSLGNISSSSVNLIKGTVDKRKQSLLMKLRSGMEKLLPHMMNPKTSSSVFKKILADKFLDNYALSEFYNSSMLGDDCTSAKPMKRIEETNRLKSHCDDQMIKMIAAIKSLEDAPAGTSVKIKANQVNLSSTQQVNNNKEAPKDPGESAALKREDKNQKK
jgi:hypothetical protein